MLEGEWIVNQVWPKVPLEDIRACLDSSLKEELIRHVRSKCLDKSTDNPRDFFKNLSNPHSIRQFMHLSLKRLHFLISWAVQCQQLMMINVLGEEYDEDQLNLNHILVPLDGSTIISLRSRAMKMLEAEFLKKFPAPLMRKNIPVLARERISDYPHSDLANFVRFQDSIEIAGRELEERPLTSRALKVIESRVWQQIQIHYKLDAEPDNKAAALDPDFSPNRRATDTNTWKEYETAQPRGSQNEAIINWVDSFTHLGPWFTSRILLRKELFNELYSCIAVKHDWNRKDYLNVLSDMEKTLLALRARMDDELQIHRLQKAIQLLQGKYSEQNDS
ncbi:MAG: hypothetical protein KDK39_12220 [Leptospiraceae bacterium]|nr:hypothetical protein [Leptospiraceae bacterium]